MSIVKSHNIFTKKLIIKNLILHFQTLAIKIKYFINL